MANAQDKVSQFETALKDLETLVARMESGEMSLEESLAAYEQGIKLFRQCQGSLEQAQLRVQQLNDPENPASATPFGEHGDTGDIPF